MTIGDLKISQATVVSPPAYVDRFVTPVIDSLFGFDDNGLPVTITLGANLTLVGNVLSATGGSGSGTVTSVAVGNLAPLFTSSVATPTVAASVTFALSTQTANRFFAGPSSGGVATPTFRSIVAADLPATAITAGSYGSATQVGSFTVDAAGRLTAAANVTVTPAFSSLTGKPTTISGYGITDAALNGAIGSSGLTMNTARLLGRTTASAGAVEEITIGSGLSLSGGALTASGSGGTITTVSVASANGFAGSVANPTTTPAITISTTVTGILYGDGTGVAAAIAANFPTLNQSTTGNAATATALQTARNINGVSFDGTANITVTAAAGTLTGTTLASNVTASSLLSAGGGTFGTAAFTAASAYEVPLTFSTGLTRSTNTVTVNTSQNIAKLSNLTSNGFVKTSGGDGTLSIDTSTYITGNQTITLSGDVTGSGTTAITTTLANIPTGVVMAGSLLATAIAAPSTPAAGKASLYVDSTSKNFAVKNDAGTVNHGIQTRAASANNWIRSIADDGSTTISQPAFTDISGSVAAAQMPALTGDATTSAGAVAVTVVKINGVSLAGLATGILKNTTITGAPSIAVAADFPTLNQSTTGSAATLTTTRAIYGNNFDGSAALTQIIGSAFGGTGNGFTKFSGPTTAEKTFTLPNASATILTDNAVVTGAQGGTGIANTSKTITLGGSITFSGAFTTTLTVTANTTITLPTTGTLATLAGTEALSNKTLTASAFNGSVGATTPSSATFTTINTTASITTSIPAGGVAYVLDASTGTSGTGMIMRFERGAALKWDFGTGISVGSDAFEVYNRVTNVSTFRLTSATDAITFGGYGAGALTTDASGNITATSDERLKVIHHEFRRGIESLRGIKPIVHSWTPESGNETVGRYAGFSAQNIQQNIPEAVGVMPSSGMLTLSDRPILATVVNSIIDLDARVTALEKAA